MSKFVGSYRVRISDVDSKGRLKLAALLSLMQEAASTHADQIGVGHARLKELGVGWALSKSTLSFKRLPRWRERITITTWPSKRTAVSTDREFIITDEKGELVATARTLFVLFDLKARRIARLSVLGQWPNVLEFADDTDFERPQFPQEGALLQSDFGVRKDDIDLNNHVNNAVYITWAMEPLSLEFCLNHEPQSIGMWFLQEVFPGERIAASCRVLGEQSFHILSSGQTERTRVVVRWKDARQCDC